MFHRKSLSQSLSIGASTIVHWTTLCQSLRSLAQSSGEDFIEWEHYRDDLRQKWENLSIMCGLVTGAVSTVVFSDYTLSPTVFALGVISLLTSLIATGYGVGFIYVLGDLRGSRFQNMMKHHSGIFMFALTIPQVWAFISFTTFFAGCAVLFWEAANKGGALKGVVILSIVLIVIHLLVFLYVFRPDNPGLHDPRPLESMKPRHTRRIFGVEVRN